ncbi:polysaccharide biosynthesis/export family protein [Palleronia caenipelagi]|uniref:polysaccharide biosynthesis/export family protein n=1 Tax=Palleronia caenipelagi TaxID=2489174 RepID=UPI001FE4A650|nr:polysaccharide biosynthesis/export family protein [Palleronia caenipelagi]
MNPPDNIEPVSEGRGYQAQYRDIVSRRSGDASSLALNAQKCRPARKDGTSFAKFGSSLFLSDILSPGDLVDVRIESDDEFSGQYVVSQDGTIRLPFLSAVSVKGRSMSSIEADLAAQLLSLDYFVEKPRVSVRLLDRAPATVAVSGAVFESRAVQIGGRSGPVIDTLRQAAMGDATETRLLSNAIRAAGGIRPDADLSSVELHRSGTIHRLDLRPLMEGTDTTDIPMLAGDRVIVPSRGCFQDNLMRPGPLSPSGVNLFLSNLSAPAQGNAPSAIGKEAREVPYGTRLIQAIVGSNCAGGTLATNAGRAVVLVSADPVSGTSLAIQRDVEALLRRGDRDDFDPYLLPGDSIACYDSTVTNVADVARILGVLSVLDVALR